MTKWGSLAIAVLLLTITLWFCTSAGFIGGVIPGIVLAVLGVVFLREKPASAH
jgi:thiamine transporter ThiT